MTIAAKLDSLGIVLSTPAAPIAAYVSCVEADGMLYLSGQLPFREDGSLICGRLGDTLTVSEGSEAAHACALMILAQVGAVAGRLDRVKRVVKLGVFVNATADFTDHPKVANGASELMQAVFGDAGRHARSAVGVPSLPLGVAVEVDAVFAVEPD